MENDGQPARAGNWWGERLTRLSQASLRINESLDVDTGIQGVLDSALYGVITLLDGKQCSGEARDDWRGA